MPGRRISSRGALAIALLAFLAGEAAAIDLPLRMTLGIEIPTLPVFVMQGTGAAQVNPVAGGQHLLSLAVTDPIASRVTTIPVTDPAVSPIQGLKFTAANDPGYLLETPGGDFRGRMPIQGVAKVCLFGPCSNAVANVLVPLSVIGNGGSVFVEGPVNVTVIGAPWTTGPVLVGSTFHDGNRVGPHGATSSTAQQYGTINLVTPIYISTNIGAIPQIDSFGYVEMHLDGEASCEVETDRDVYHDGDTVQLTRLRFQNQNLTGSYRLVILFRVPAPPGDVVALDQTFTLARGFDHDLGPVSTVNVAPALPRGRYSVLCSIIDTSTGSYRNDEASFQIE